MSRYTDFYVEVQNEFGEWELAKWLTRYDKSKHTKQEWFYSPIGIFKRLKQNLSPQKFKLLKSVYKDTTWWSFFVDAIKIAFKKTSEYIDEPDLHYISGDYYCINNHFTKNSSMFNEYLSKYSNRNVSMSYELEDIINKEKESNSFTHGYCTLGELNTLAENELMNVVNEICKISMEMYSVKSEEKIDRILSLLEKQKKTQEECQDDEYKRTREDCEYDLDYIKDEKLWYIINLFRVVEKVTRIAEDYNDECWVDESKVRIFFSME